MWSAGWRSISKDIETMLGWSTSMWWWMCWNATTPALLVVSIARSSYRILSWYLLSPLLQYYENSTYLIHGTNFAVRVAVLVGALPPAGLWRLQLATVLRGVGVRSHRRHTSTSHCCANCLLHKCWRNFLQGNSCTSNDLHVLLVTSCATLTPTIWVLTCL